MILSVSVLTMDITSHVWCTYIVAMCTAYTTLRTSDNNYTTADLNTQGTRSDNPVDIIDTTSDTQQAVTEDFGPDVTDNPCYTVEGCNTVVACTSNNAGQLVPFSYDCHMFCKCQNTQWTVEPCSNPDTQRLGRDLIAGVNITDTAVESLAMPAPLGGVVVAPVFHPLRKQCGDYPCVADGCPYPDRVVGPSAVYKIPAANPHCYNSIHCNHGRVCDGTEQGLRLPYVYDCQVYCVCRQTGWQVVPCPTYSSGTLKFSAVYHKCGAYPCVTEDCPFAKFNDDPCYDVDGCNTVRVCDTTNEGGVEPFPYDCKVFCKCHEARWTLQPCYGKDSLFDAVTKQCGNFTCIAEECPHPKRIPFDTFAKSGDSSNTYYWTLVVAVATGGIVTVTLIIIYKRRARSYKL